MSKIATVRRDLGALLVAATFGLALLIAPQARADTANDTTSFAVVGGSLSFSTIPAMPTLGAVTLTGSAQTTSSTMTNFAVADSTGSGSGWNVTVNGLSGAGKSTVFKQYCPNATCGTDSGPGYVASGYTLPADSLTLASTGASFSPSTSAPTYQCASACDVDSASPVKLVSAAPGAGMGTYATTGWGASSLGLTTPGTLHALQPNEVYRVDLVWTLTSGP
jgi:hypothetical protein